MKLLKVDKGVILLVQQCEKGMIQPEINGLYPPRAAAPPTISLNSLVIAS